MEWVDGTMSGPIDFNAIIYPMASIMGSVSPVTHGVSTTAKDWVFVPPVTGSIVPQTYTIQQGDGTTRNHQLAYALFNKFDYKLTRKDVTCGGGLIAQALTDNISMTGSPTSVALAPVASKMFNVYIDTTSANLGTTQYLRVLSVDYSFDSVYEPLWVLNRANLTWPAHVDMKPKASVKVTFEADSQGMGVLPTLQSGSSLFMRVVAQGNVIDNLQTVSLGSPSAGTFTLTYKAVTTAGIAYNATAATVQTALTGLSTVGAGNATVSGSAGGPYSVIFTGTLAQDTTAMTGSGGGLTGGTFTITQNQSYNIFQHDMAVKVGKPSTFKDDSGVFAIEWELTIVEDATWGNAQKVTVTNLITAL